MRPTIPPAAAWSAAALLALPVLLRPVYNPDLFWHLSAARWIWDNRALPRSDFLAFYAAGQPWVDFEWLSQLVFGLLHAWGGFAALWLCKAALLAGAWVVMDRLLASRGLNARARALGLILWSAAMLGHSDLRPELFSVLLLCLLLSRLERPSPGSNRAWLFVLFALWANLHAGFAVGLGLILCCAAAAPARRKGLLLDAAAAAAGTLCNPYGTGPWRVLATHWKDSPALARSISEWQPMSFANPLNWPFWPLLALLVGLTVAALRRRQGPRPGWGLPLAALGLGAATLAHGRTSVFFGVTAVPAILLMWDGRPARGALAGLGAYAAFLLWLAWRLSWPGVFDWKRVPQAAAAFIEDERPVMSGLRLYNQWEWGGYLGWRLHPWFKVFCDGRYLFHEQLARTGDAVRSPELWQEFMNAEGLSGAVMLNLDTALPARKRYPDGTERDFPRPWYVFYMPKPRWALVYWDRQALVFVERGQVPAAWLAAHEYRYVRPKDEAAFQEALRLQEIPAAAAAAEAVRHEAQVKLYKR